MTTDMIPEMIGVKECSERTGLSYNALRLMCLDNKIPHIRCGRTIKINYSALCRILNGEEVFSNGKGKV